MTTGPTDSSPMPRLTVPGVELAKDLVSTCGLTPDQIDMVNVPAFIADTFGIYRPDQGWPCDQIPARLAAYHAAHGDSWTYLLGNPALTQGWPPLMDMRRLAFISMTTAIVVDAERGLVLKGTSLPAFPAGATSAPLTPASETELTTWLASWLGRWRFTDRDWQRDPADPVLKSYNWRLAWDYGDGTLYRWSADEGSFGATESDLREFEQWLTAWAA
ncbi:MAG: hypothetical protein FWC46_04280 [Actinomycetia bacterium]|nr:hypothetical protein [Actinomycetes bacterium]